MEDKANSGPNQGNGEGRATDAGTDTSNTGEAQSGTGGQDEARTMSEREAQAMADRRVQQAIAKKEAEFHAAQQKREQEAEQKRLAEAQEFEKLYSQEKQARERLELQTATVQEFTKAGLGAFVPLFDLDTTTLDGRKAMAEQLKGILSEQVSLQVRDKLEGGHKPDSSAPASSPKSPGDNMTAEEWAAWKKSEGIQ